jgi:hypothetical protein
VAACCNNNCGITNDWTGVGWDNRSSSFKQSHNSVNNPNRFHESDDDDDDNVSLLMAESSGLFVGIRKGILDLDMADRSEALEGVVEYTAIEGQHIGNCLCNVFRSVVPATNIFLEDAVCLVKATAPCCLTIFPIIIMNSTTFTTKKFVAFLRRVEFMGT